MMTPKYPGDIRGQTWKYKTMKLLQKELSKALYPKKISLRKKSWGPDISQTWKSRILCLISHRLCLCMKSCNVF